MIAYDALHDRFTIGSGSALHVFANLYKMSLALFRHSERLQSFKSPAVSTKYFFVSYVHSQLDHRATVVAAVIVLGILFLSARRLNRGYR